MQIVHPWIENNTISFLKKRNKNTPQFRYGLDYDFRAIKQIRFEMAEILILNKLKTLSKILKMDFRRKTAQRVS